MPNLIDFYKRIFLHVIPVRIIVPCLHQLHYQSWLKIQRFYKKRKTQYQVENNLYLLLSFLSRAFFSRPNTSTDTWLTFLNYTLYISLFNYVCFLLLYFIRDVGILNISGMYTYRRENITLNKWKLKKFGKCWISHALSGICNISWINKFRINCSLKGPTPYIKDPILYHVNDI